MTKPFLFPLLLTAALLLLIGARPAAAAPLDTPWAGGGDGTTTVVSDGKASDPEFKYSARGSFTGSWTYATTAATTRTVPVKWEYSGLHAWYAVTVKVERFVKRGGTEILTETLHNVGPTNCCEAPSNGFAYSGTTSFDVQKGDVYGFRLSGSNFDYNQILDGALVLREVDGTPPVITPAITGKQAAGGYYAGPATVKWTVRDADSRLLTRSGCDDATVTEDTAGKTITCTATSRGGSTTKSVTIKKDTVAPEVTVPPVVVQQGSAIVNYSASARDALDGNPLVECSHPSGSSLPVGTTTITCTATDAAGNAAGKSFDAIVIAAAAAPQPTIKPAVKPRRINAVLAFRFVITNKTTRLVQLKVKNIPAGASVTITCKGNSCPKKLKGSGTTRMAKGSSVSLATLVKAGLKSGTIINVKVSRPGALTTIKTLMVRRGKAPVVK